ncbi:MAG: thymidylate synthase [Proteobacteria bacterium]|nr:thymidylate synthase [Pseudomonadota bacterium]
MQSYLNLLQEILQNGCDAQDRTGVGTRSLFGHQLRFDLNHGFPIVTTKKVHFKAAVYELLWMLRGDTHIQYLADHGVTIWHPWADEQGELGRVYGAQWRSWQTPSGATIDQISRVLQSLKDDPTSRRHLVVAYNPGELDQMALPPCHAFFQFAVKQEKLHCQMYQRSADIFLGVPFNIVSYSLLTIMIAKELGYGVGEFIHTFGDVHLYHNHFDQAKLQLSRQPLPLPTLTLNPNVNSIFDYSYEDIRLENYQHHPTIKAPVAV